MSLFDRIRLIPKLAWYGARAPRDETVAWDRYWSSVRQTGQGGDVLWDAGGAVPYILTSRYTFVNANLATLYGLPPPSST